jgi:hypothetical protein
LSDRELENLLRAIPRPPRGPPPTAPRTPQTRDTGRPNPPQANTPNNPNVAVSRSDVDAIGQHIARFWTVPLGAQGAENLMVELHVQLLANGTVQNVTIEDQARYRSDPVFRAAADSAMRAVRLASPLPLPAGRAEQFRDLIIPFDPRRVMGMGG